jgi:hypothetical protein
MAIAGLTSCGGGNPYDYTASAPGAVVVADFNGDGLPDVAVASAQINQLDTNERPGLVALLLQDASNPGQFSTSPPHFQTDGNPSAMDAGDILGTGGVDLAVANYNKGSISVLLETSPGAGNFQNANNLATNGSPTDVAICDVNGDGHADLVVSDGSASGGHLIVIPQDPSSPGQFLAASAVADTPTYSGATVPDPAYGIACGNLNGDGHSQDVVLVSFASDSTGAPIGASGMVSIFPHDPANPGHFLQRIDIPVAGLVHRVKIADLNNDGLPDLVIANEGVDGTGVGAPGVAVLLQNAASPGTFAAPVTYATYPAISVAVGDLNGDGLPDLVIASPPSVGLSTGLDAVQVLYNVGSSPGTFGSAPAPCDTSGNPECAGLGNPVSVAIGDLNHDGLPDIATADSTGAVVLFQSQSSPSEFETGVYIGG